MTTTFQRDGYLTALGLVALALVPAIAGIVRLTELGGGVVTPDNARFIADPLPVITHIVSALVFAIAGAFQFAPGIRRRWPDWHRHAGRALVIAGLLTAQTGLQLNMSPDLPVADTGLLVTLRIAVGAALMATLVIGIAAARQGDIPTHRAFMIRAYAIAMGAGTQVLTHMPYMLLVGAPDEGTRTVLMAAGWLINMAVAEWLIRRQPVRRTHYRAAPYPQTA